MNKYIKIARPDHWIKQFFVFPGCLFAFLLAGMPEDGSHVVFRIIAGFLSTCLIASSNYVINEWLDAEFDKFHPTKKYRSVVQEDVKGGLYISNTVYFPCWGSGQHGQLGCRFLSVKSGYGSWGFFTM